MQVQPAKRLRKSSTSDLAPCASSDQKRVKTRKVRSKNTVQISFRSQTLFAIPPPIPSKRLETLTQTLTSILINLIFNIGSSLATQYKTITSIYTVVLVVLVIQTRMYCTSRRASIAQYVRR